MRAELGKVDYLNRQQTIQATLVVLGACILVGLYLYGLDQVFARLADAADQLAELEPRAEGQTCFVGM